MTKSTRGGSRPGSGQPKKEPTKVLTFRVPEKWKDIIKALVAAKLAELKNLPPK